MAIKKIGATIALDGEAKFKSAITGINASMKTMTSDLKLVTSEFSRNANSMEALTKKGNNLSQQYDKQKEKVDVYKSALDNASKTEQTAATRVNDLRTKLADAEKKMSEMKNSTDTTSEELEEQEKVVKNLSSEVTKAETTYGKAQVSTAKWQTSLNNAQTDLNKLDDEVKTNKKYLDEAKNSTTKTATSIDEYGREVTEATTATTTFGDVLKANLVGTAIVSGMKLMGRAIKEVATFSVEAGSAFTFSMSQVSALSGETGAVLDELAEKARQLGEDTIFSASQCADGLQYMALAGWNAKEMLDGLDGVVYMASAANMDLAEASDILTDAITAMGDSAQDSNRYADVLAKTQASSNTTVSMLGESFKNAAATAGSYGYELEDVSATLGVMANAGIKGAQSGTQLNTIITRLATNTNGARDTLEELGVEFYNVDGSARPLSEVITGLADATAGMTSEQKASITTQIAGKRAVTGLNAILNQGSRAYNELRDTLLNCDGAAQQMSATMNDNLKGDMTILKSTTESLGITIFDKFEKPFRQAVQNSTKGIKDLGNSIESGDLSGTFEQLGESVGELAEGAIDFAVKAVPVVADAFSFLVDNGDMVISTLGGVAAGFAVFKGGTLIQAVVTSVQSFASATTSAGVAQGAFNVIANANPYVLLATAIGGVITALAIFAGSNEDAKTETELLADEVDSLCESMDNASESASKSEESYKKSIAQIEAEGKVARDTATELYDLAESGDDSEFAHRKMETMVAKLNAIYPELNLQIDEETGLLNKNRSEVNKGIESAKAYYKAKSAQKQLQSVADEQVENEIKLQEALAKSSEITERLTAIEQERARLGAELQKEQESATGAVNAYGGAVSETQQKIVELSNEEKLLKEQQAELEESSKTLTDTNVGLDEQFNALQETYSTTAEQAGITADATSELGSTTTETAEAMMTAEEQIAEATAEATESVLSSLEQQTDGFEAFNAGTEYSKEQLLANLQSQIEGVANWSTNIQALADRGINQGLIQTLIDAGPSSANAVLAMTQMTDTELSEYNRLWTEKLNINDDVANVLSGMTETVRQAGEDVVKNAQDSSTRTTRTVFEEAQRAKALLAQEGTKAGKAFNESYASGANSSKNKPLKSTQEMIASVMGEANSGFGVSGASALKLERIGELTPFSLATGVRRNAKLPTNEAKTVASDVVNTTDTNLSIRKFEGIGENIPQGLANGIYDNMSVATNAARSLGSAVERSARVTLRINSPSKVFEEIGEYTGEGFEVGYKKRMANIQELVQGSMDFSALTQNGIISSGLTGSASASDQILEASINVYVDGKLEKTDVVRQVVNAISRQQSSYRMAKG